MVELAKTPCTMEAEAFEIVRRWVVRRRLRRMILMEVGWNKHLSAKRLVWYIGRHMHLFVYRYASQHAGLKPSVADVKEAMRQVFRSMEHAPWPVI